MLSVALPPGLENFFLPKMTTKVALLHSLVVAIAKTALACSFPIQAGSKEKKKKKRKKEMCWTTCPTHLLFSEPPLLLCCNRCYKTQLCRLLWLQPPLLNLAAGLKTPLNCKNWRAAFKIFTVKQTGSQVLFSWSGEMLILKARNNTWISNFNNFFLWSLPSLVCN